MKRFGAIVLITAIQILAPRLATADRYAIVITGASGSAQHQAMHAKRRDALVSALVGPLGVPAANVTALKDVETGQPDSATRDHVVAAVKSVGARLTDSDTLLIVLLGHGTDDGRDVKFNLIGPDMTGEEWRSLVQNLKGRLVFVNTTSASSGFLTRVAGPKRIVITATDTPAQQYDTVFAEYLGSAFTSEESDLDKDGRVSVGEAFAFVSARVKKYYSEKGQLATERAVIDDTGDGKGKESGSAGPDGELAARTYFDAGPEVAASRDAALSELLARRDTLESSLDELKRKKEFMPAADYATELERLLTDLARLSRQIRARS